MSNGISQVGFAGDHPLVRGGDEIRIVSDRGVRQSSGRAGSVEDQRPVGIGFDHAVGGLAVVLGPLP